MHNNKPSAETYRHTNRFWIMGAGRFGRIAISRITRRFPEATLTVVDERKVDIPAGNATFIRANAMAWLSETLTENALVDILVPMIPVHVAAKWLAFRLEKNHRITPVDVQEDWLALAPNAMPGARGQAYVSHANFLCPDNCPEPKDICTHTGKPRPMDMFELLKQICPKGVKPVVLRSHQITPGVGGIVKADLFQALNEARDNRHLPLMIATACRCHGVVDFMRITAS